MTTTVTRSTVLVLLVVLAALLLVIASPAGPGFSSAAFTAQTTNSASRAGAATDWTPPSVTVEAPSGALRGTATVTALATDGETGVRDVVLSIRPAGTTTGTTTLCTTAAQPFRCAWDTRTVADGDYDVRAVATDRAGNTVTSAPVRVSVANTVTVTLANPGALVRATVPLVTTLHNAGSPAPAVRVEYAVAGTGDWKALCTGLAAPYTCSWSTAAVADGSYDVRSSVTIAGTTILSEATHRVRVDNTAPVVTIADPGARLASVVTLSATASDSQSGVTRVVFQYVPHGTTTWQDACVLTASPYSCRFDTASVADGAYSFRAVATDLAGNTAGSTVGPRTIENTVASVVMEDPGAHLAGVVTLRASAQSTAGVKTVQIQRSPAGAAAWTTVCTLNAAPFSCTWDTRPVSAGAYDFRAVLTDLAGKQVVSDAVTGRRVDNRPVRGLDVQTSNGGSTPGLLEAGDTMTYTYSTQLDTASIAPGWNGIATPVTLRLRDGNLLSLGNSGDTVDVLLPNSATAVNLGSVVLHGDYIRNNGTAVFAATMTTTTVTVDGQPVTVVHLTVGQLLSDTGLRVAPPGHRAAMVWTPSPAATDLAGVPSSNQPVTESGDLDREF